MKEMLERLNELTKSVMLEGTKFIEKENRTAGTRCRQVLSELKMQAHNLRKEIMTIKKLNELRHRVPAALFTKRAE